MITLIYKFKRKSGLGNWENKRKRKAQDGHLTGYFHSHNSAFLAVVLEDSNRVTEKTPWFPIKLVFRLNAKGLILFNNWSSQNREKWIHQRSVSQSSLVFLYSPFSSLSIQKSMAVKERQAAHRREGKGIGFLDSSQMYKQIKNGHSCPYSKRKKNKQKINDLLEL